VIEFVCDSCRRVKDPDEIWILGLAAEAVGVTAARREVSIISVWDRENAVHPLGVHFCSEDCKDKYLQMLFGNTEQPAPAVTTEVVTRKVRRTAPVVTTEVVTAKTGRKTPRVVKKTKVRKARRRAA
jgi:hypothetical protein